MLEARYDPDRGAQSPVPRAFIAFNTFCPRIDLRTDALIERLREIGTPVGGVEPPYDVLVERATRPSLNDGEPGLTVRRCEIRVRGEFANEVVAMLSLTDSNVWSFGATVALPRGASGMSDARFIGAFESMDPRTFLVEVGVRDAGRTPETYMRADLLTPEDAQ